MTSSGEPIPLLLDRAREQDAEAVGTLLERYRGYLMLLARTQIGRRLQGKADPADLVQETFLEAHKHFENFRGQGEAELTAWLRRLFASVMANHVRRYFGTQLRDARLEQDLALEIDNASGVLQRGLAATTSTPSRQVAKREALVALASALEQLPPDYRQVIILRHLEGLPFAEVAARMERTVASVQNLWVRALRRLKQSIGDSW